ncbi:arsenite efflux transporter metallochaperone ArsD [Salimicrobium flavidum]|uniref:Arsenical resistance operon trans-acting repressor ArsD n=1 Tax=Salimicrobium flavidum TaxID=570947 RepID=A0A1N7IRU3_9BACI|nr:arsenite efflux transporter metallochaperone ArsD [Salimicrobium flavidum]SIS39737.1 Arsenical resistance operon trans-acting repressor ArsD [Salimicrobium flavidum]
MKKLEIYDPAMCCSTGVCGPGVDPELVRVASAVHSLKKHGYDVVRFNLAEDPGAFTENETVNRLLQEEGADVLPVTLLDGEVLKKEKHPSNEELSGWFGIEAGSLEERPTQKVTIELSDLT